MSPWKRIIRVCKFLLPINLLLAGAAAACLEYPVFRLREIEIAFADNREVTPEFYQKVCQAIPVTPDSNLFSVDENKIVKAILARENDLVRVDARLVLPDKLFLRLHIAQPALWWSAHQVFSLAGDGRSVDAPAGDRGSGFPIGVGDNATDGTIERWRMIEFYQSMVEHDPRWGEVISQIEHDPQAGWLLVLNGGAERIFLGKHADFITFDRVARFLETVPEEAWAGATIDARFGGRIIITSPAVKGRKTRRENSSPPVGGRS